MSMMLMVKAFGLKVGSAPRKLVLLKLADNANDKGECWPSYQHIADQCEISKRSAMNHIDALCKAGYVRKQHREGPKGNSSNMYYLVLGGEKSASPSANASPPSENVSPPPGAESAPRISHSFEPVSEAVSLGASAPKKQQRLNVTEFQDQVDTEALQAFVDHRKAIRAPLTQRALKLTVDSALSAAQELGITAEQALDVAIESGWRTIKVDWLRNRGFTKQAQSGCPECPHAELLAIWDETCGPVKGKAPNVLDWKGTKSAEAMQERWEEFYAPDGSGRYSDRDSGLRWWHMALKTIAAKQDFRSAEVSIWDIFYKTRFSKAANGKLSGMAGASR